MKPECYFQAIDCSSGPYKFYLDNEYKPQAICKYCQDSAIYFFENRNWQQITWEKYNQYIMLA